MRNAIIRFFKEKFGNTTNYLHILAENIDILKDPMDFINDIEYMMNLLDLNSWFGTVCDPCNFIYSKYNPRLRLHLDAEYCKDLKIKQLLFTSHANTYWTIYNINKATDYELYLDESFSIAMFYIIKFLAERRNRKPNGKLYYMNQYPTVESEYNVYSAKDFNNKRNDTEQQMKQEDELFKSMNIDYSPDNNIDKILEDLHNLLNK